jgi:hypothetical protein
MKSSFKKVEKKPIDTNKVYFGNAWLDACLNNSLRKGHVFLIEEDHPTTIYVSLLRYYIGSGHHKGQLVQIYDSTNPAKWKQLVP